eukprot:TRINITY_DN49211_c0_g1_i1.p1 TRINITY_DN49211_c0_g1~~TRINITY_DN49211_c0_g1_i1.p1  ORF type:complete len:570 (+),score=92.31 TRINITY_DN49211_c0_g1_i1:63-1712(+)
MAAAALSDAFRLSRKRLRGGSPLRWCFSPWEAVGTIRNIRTGFFQEDEDYIDPEIPLLSERSGSRWRCMDDPTLQSPLLGRSNVGMGIMILNRPAGFDLPTINSAYKRLRNFEVNSFLRFVGLTASDPGPFCVGLDPKELLLVAVASMRQGRVPRFARALLWNQQELAHLVADYRKPLVCQISGQARDAGAALACLSNFSGAHDESEIVIQSCREGLVPFGGMTYVLGRLPWHLGEFLSLTSWPLRGADIVYSGLARHWMSPDALPFLELTAEKHLEVSETDSHALLDEHSLPLPDGFGDSDSLPMKWVPLIHSAFREKSISLITKNLESMSASGDQTEKNFADTCLQRMRKAAPLALHATLRLVREARAEAQDRQISTPQGRQVYSKQSFDFVSRGDHGTSGPLVNALRRELMATERLLSTGDAVVGLHGRCIGKAPETWSRSSILDVDDLEVDELLREPATGQPAGFAVCDRPDMPLSSHPRLRRYHPDYNEKIGLDHDPPWLAAEVQRWSPDLFREERQSTMEELLGGSDPATFGLSRWTRVDPHA